jgi:hypothetical protein
MRYVKQKSTGEYLSSQSSGDPSNPYHLSHMVDEVVVGLGIPADDLESGYMDDTAFRTAMSAQEEAAMSYSDKRKVEYPPATDYLDGIVKGDQAQIDQYIADCLAVKDKFPK